jgi:protein-S-isoprenylcysteine O-methyltransferase Ste14
MIQRILERWSAQPEEATRDLIVLGCAFAVLFSVTWSFLNYHHKRDVRRGKRSAVDTFTMLLFFALFSWFISRQTGVIRNPVPGLKLVCIVLGLSATAVGCFVNVWGRHQLGSTWSNQIAIYEGHKLITAGLFSIVRHPLYASTIWMFLGAAVAYLNWAALALTIVLFVPAMHLRARQEERLLAESFPEYAVYRARTGTFFPKVFASKHT